MNLKEKFKKTAQLLIEADTKKKSTEAVKLLIDFYEELLEGISIDELSGTESMIEGGVALSPKHAKECLEDYERTASFIKGVYKAINSTKKKFKNNKLEIIYAGTGPLATLIVPILPFFSSNEISVSLIDIHESSIMYVKKIFEYLEYEEYVNGYYIEDATNYKHNAEKLHMVITETMDKALTKEPQVLITQNLANQLTDGGVLVPEEIKLTTRNSFCVKEKEFGATRNYEDYINNNRFKNLFSITKGIGRIEQEFSFESSWISFEEDYVNTPDICIYTEIKVFDDIYLKRGESLITNTYCVKSLYAIEGNRYRLHYSTIGVPKWEVST